MDSTIFGRKQLSSNKQTSINRIVGSTEITKIRNLGNFLWKVKCKWKTHTKRFGGGTDGTL
jgi:hypothetical protein